MGDRIPGTCTGELFYDGSCPLCQAEIHRLQQLSDGDLELQDIHALANRSDLPPPADLLKTLHYRSADGEMLVGLRANVAAWQHTRFGFLWRIFEWPLVRPVASAVYDVWARWRYRRLYAGD